MFLLKKFLRFFLLLLFFSLLFFSFPQHHGKAYAVGTQLSFTILLHGIGKGGDNTNASAQGNMNPLNKQRLISVGIFNAQNTLVTSKTLSVTYNATSGNFTGSADFGSIPSGAYTMTVRTNKYLQKAISGIQTITSGQSKQLPSVTLIAGDMVVDNQINIQDYNLLMNCFSDLTPARSCTVQQKTSADLTDDGVVNQLDYNLFIREISNHSGEGNPTAAPLPTAVPTKTVAPTPTITIQSCSGSGPITISVGGTYSGCYESKSIGTPAVKIATTAPVTIDHATILHAGQAIVNSVNGVQLTVTNSKIQASNPGQIALQRIINFTSPSSLVFEHNKLIDGQGIWLGAGNPTTVRIRYNDVKNIGRYPYPTSPNCCVQFTQFSEITVGNAEIAWNRVMNTYLQSGVEDNINMWKSSGLATHPIDIHNNLISGAYPRSGNGSGFTGGGILAGDSGGNYINIHDNRVVSTSNYGVAISGGHDNHLYNNRVVNDGKADDGSAVGPSTATGISLWQYDPQAATGPNANAYNNTIGWVQPNGTRNDTWLPACNPSNACTNNVSMPNPITAASEQAERDAWANDVTKAGLTIGTNW